LRCSAPISWRWIWRRCCCWPPWSRPSISDVTKPRRSHDRHTHGAWPGVGRRAVQPRSGRTDDSPQHSVCVDESGDHDERRRAGLRRCRCPLGSGRRSGDVHPGDYPCSGRGQYRSGDPAATVSPLQNPGYRCCQRDARMNMLFLTLLFPLIGFLLLAFSRGRWSENTSALVGVGSVGLSALVSAWIIFQYSTGALPDGAYIQVLWQWMAVGNFTPSLTL